MSNEVLVLSTDSTGNKKRIYELIADMMRLQAAYQDTWCSLLKTKMYLKSLNTISNIRKQIRKRVLCEVPDMVYFNIELIGSKRQLDVIVKRKQKYLITYRTS